MGLESNLESGFFNDFKIPNYIFLPDSKYDTVPMVPTCPVIVFINSKSGGQLGGDLLHTFRSLLNENQVFDLREEPPDAVLHRLYANLEKLAKKGDECAMIIRNKLRLIVAGGDGTAGWLLGVVCDLKLSHPPPIATMPLGTGNNIPFAFGWGKKNPGTDCHSVKSFLHQILKAQEMKIDSWHIAMRMNATEEGPCDPIPPLELPQSLHAFHRVSATDTMSKEGCDTFRGGFWNYFSMGMDAQISYAFHSERKLHPEKFKNQFINQSTYAKLGCKQGWFMASVFHPLSRNIAQLAKVQVLSREGKWKDLHVPSSMRSIVCLNLPSFSGGLNPWGTPNAQRRRDREWSPPYVDDGLLEVVGFRDAWHGLVLFAPHGHGRRLAQTRGIRFEFNKCGGMGDGEHTFMRIDGEPWKQPLPKHEKVVIEISHLGQVNMLATHDCKSQSVSNPNPRNSGGEEVEDEEDSNNEEEAEEACRKFGAADTFKIPNDIDISQLS